MKTILTIACLFSAAAYADYVPGRVRLSAEGNLPAREGTGAYRDIDTTRVLEYRTDEKGISHYQVEVGGVSRTYLVEKIRHNKCEDVITAVFHGEDGTISKFKLIDRSVTVCDRSGRPTWMADLTNEAEEDSSLEISGEPEYFSLTH